MPLNPDVARLLGVPCSTDALVADARRTFPDIESAKLEEAIPKCIDALYAARDAGLSMHHAGAYVAVTALRA